MPAIKFLDVDSFTRRLTPITSTDFFTRTGEFNTEGLFSEDIFGAVGSLERSQKFSYIDMKANVVHPTALKLLVRLDRRIEKFISTEEHFKLNEQNQLEISEDGVTGLSKFIELFPNINFKGETETRDKIIVLLKKAYKDKILFISKIPVIPPDHRPIYQDDSGNWIYDQINNLYLTIMRRAAQLSSVGSAGELYDLLNYGLQMAILDYDKYVRSKVEKKRGLVRDQLMGKRVDFSGRAVITPGPDLKVNEIGVPLRLAVSLFEPFLIHILVYSKGSNKEALSDEIKKYLDTELSVDSVRRVIKAIESGDEIPEELRKIFWDATELAMRNRVVLAKRDPVLHAESVRAFKPVLVEGTTIQLCTLQVGGFNADFDGDQMAIFHPLTSEAQEEAKTKMTRAKTGQSTVISFEISKEMAVGLYLLSKPSKSTKPEIAVKDEDFENASDPSIPVIYRGKKMTMGIAIIMSCLPPNYPVIDYTLTKSSTNKILRELVNKYSDEVAQEAASKLAKYGFKFATIMAPSISLKDIELPASIYRLKPMLKNASTEEAIEIIGQMKKLLLEHLKDTGLFALVDSGSTKGWDQPMQILVAKGIIADPKGNLLPPIEGSFSDGLSNKEFFTASAGARKGIIDRTLNTADTGYVSRKLIYVMNSVEADLVLKDCKTDKLLNVALNKDLMGRLIGRWALVKNKLVEFNSDDFRSGEVIQIRTPIYCKSRKICHTCYGRLLERHRSPYIGVLAAQIIGERGTQMIMKTFHTGGAVKIEKRDVFGDITENDPLVEKSNLLKYMYQTENLLNCKKPCTLLLDMNDYEVDGTIKIDDNMIWVKALICKVEFDDFMFNMILDYPIELKVQEMKKIGKEYIELQYGADSTILEIPLDRQELKEMVRYVERLLGGKEVYKNTDHLYRKLYKTYAPLGGDMDSVHLEVLLSQCLRDRKNPNIPARLGSTWDPVMMSIKNIVFTSGFQQGVAFEQLGKAITTGLIEEGPPEKSILEKVLTGTLVGEKE